MKLSEIHKKISEAGIVKALLPENVAKGDPLTKYSFYELLDQLSEEFEEFEEAIIDCIDNSSSDEVGYGEFFINCACAEAGDLLNVMSFLIGFISGNPGIERE